MSRPTPPDDAPQTLRFPAWWFGAGAILALFGVVCFLYGTFTEPARAWQALLVAFLVWGGMSMGLVAWAAILRTTNGRWAPSVIRLGQSSVAFLPVAWLVLAFLYFGKGYFLLWLGQPQGDRTIWLNAPGLFLRDLLGLAVLIAAMVNYIRLNLDADAAAGRDGDPAKLEGLQRQTTHAAVGVLFAYVIVGSLIGSDLIMSLDGRWFSALLPAHYFVVNLYAGMAGIIVLALMARRLGADRYLGPRRLQDCGSLLISFELMSIWFMYDQLLTIWYGGIPRETSWFIPRWHEPVWWPWGYVVLAFYLGPFLFLIWREVKRTPVTLGAIAVAVIFGAVLERYYMVVPTLRPTGPGINLVDLGILLGLGGVKSLCEAWFLGRYPAVSQAELRLGYPEVG